MITRRSKDFFESQEAKDIRRILKRMTLDKAYNTDSSYSANSLQYADNLIPFVDKHMNYLNSHPKVEADQYIANIKLMSRIR